MQFVWKSNNHAKISWFVQLIIIHIISQAVLSGLKVKYRLPFDSVLTKPTNQASEYGPQVFCCKQCVKVLCVVCEYRKKFWIPLIFYEIWMKKALLMSFFCDCFTMGKLADGQPADCKLYIYWHISSYLYQKIFRLNCQSVLINQKVQF